MRKLMPIIGCILIFVGAIIFAIGLKREPEPDVSRAPQINQAYILAGAAVTFAVTTQEITRAEWNAEGRTYSSLELQAATQAKVKAGLPWIEYPTEAQLRAATAGK